ncbi:hypothetical protein [Simkania sp.]|uniref:hypothetical protein n=1 Tax=Simkania sp. TaxID=34094 RepID=UPI003B518112
MAAVSRPNDSMQKFFHQVSHYKEKSSGLSDRQVSSQAGTTSLLSSNPNLAGDDLVLMIQQSNPSTKTFRSFLESKSFEELRSFNRGLKQLEKDVSGGNQGAVAQMKQVLVEVGRAKKEVPTPTSSHSSSSAAVMEGGLSRVDIDSNPIQSSSTVVPDCEKRILKGIMALNPTSHTLAEDAEKILADLNEAKKQGLVTSKQAESLEFLLKLIQTNCESYPGGEKLSLLQDLRQKYPALELEADDKEGLSNFSARLIKSLQGQASSSTLEQLCVASDSAKASVSKKLDAFLASKAKSVSPQFAQNFTRLFQAFDSYIEGVEEVVPIFTSQKQKELSTKVGGKFHVIEQKLPFFDICKKDALFKRELQLKFREGLDLSLLKKAFW